MKRNILAIGLMIGLLVGILVACGAGEGTEGEASQEPQPSAGEPAASNGDSAEAPTPIPTVDIADIFGQASEDTPLVEFSGGVSGIGEVEAAQDADLVFTVDGTIEEVYVEEGDEVKKISCWLFWMCADLIIR
ncbi:MAG: hypothetical protein HC884_14585 [Chloroflexaceae bacterium]|nr:hypothetical protein [Chloroflexaceae bacterium]